MDMERITAPAEHMTRDEASMVREAMAELSAEENGQEKTRIPLTHRVWAKTAAFVFVILMAVVAIAAVVGAVCMIEFGIYTTPKESCRYEVMENLAEGVVSDVVRYVMAGDEAGAARRIEHKNISGMFIDLTGMNGGYWTYGSTYEGVQNAAYRSRWLVLEGGEILPDHGYYTEAEIVRMGADCFTAQVLLSSEFTEEDEFLLADMALDAVYALRYWIYAIGLGALVLGIVAFVFLMCASGRRAGFSDPQPGWGTRIPFDLLTAVVCLGLMSMMAVLSEMSYYASEPLLAVMWILSGIMALVLLLGWCMSAALRLKLGKWWKNTVIFRLVKLVCFVLRKVAKWIGGWLRAVRSLAHGIPIVWKTAATFAAVSFVEFIYLMEFHRDTDMMLFGWFLEHMVLFAAAIWLALCLRRLQKGGEALAAGDLSHQVDTNRMPLQLRQHAENLSHIGEGMSAAVEERLKSERMKTELITNVSHDIKTPLTSIINYSDLIGKEKTENEKITEYAEVLHRQSERLKRLIEDLVEASRASTGDIEVLLAPCEVGVILSQAAGEYEERLKQSELTLITRQPEAPVKIMADGRRLWRVVDNLMGNICKYAMPGTRVYLTLEEENGAAVISFKNTSREPLDLSADELAERFVRGDASRSSEGSGLGLSIAKSLAQLQNGDLALTVDGDLFKAVLRFPTI